MSDVVPESEKQARFNRLRLVRKKRTCPVCRVELVRINVHGVSGEACPQCGGSVFTADELAKHSAAGRALESLVPPAMRVVTSGSLPCPACGKPMQQLAATSVLPFALNHCTSDGVYWFTGNEFDTVHKLLTREWEPSAPPASSGEIAARNIVQRIKARNRKIFFQKPDADAIETAFFSEMSRTQRVLALLGIPIKAGPLYMWQYKMPLVLILINVVVYVLMFILSDPEYWIRRFAFYPCRFDVRPWATFHTLLTSMFMHGGVFHLLGNMLFLFSVGDDVEKRMGRWPFLATYVTGGVAGCLTSYVVGHGWFGPHVGASGAISAVVGAFYVFCRDRTFYVWLFIFAVFGKLFSVASWLYIMLWFALQFVGLSTGQVGIGYFAHIGGFLLGVIAASYVKRLQAFDPYTGEWAYKSKRSAPRHEGAPGGDK